MTVAMLAAPAMADDQQQVQPTRLAHQLGDTPFNVQGLTMISLAIGIIGGIVGLFVFMRTMRRENEADARASEERIKEAHKIDADRIESASRERGEEIKTQLSDLRVSLGERVAKIEGSVADFVGRKELDGRFEHDKNGSIQRDGALERRIDRNADDIRGLLVDVGSLKQRQDSFGLSLARIEELIRENNRETSAKLDKMSDAIEARRPRA